MLAMQPADILCQSSLPGDRHRQKQCVEPSVIKAFANVATCREYQAPDPPTPALPCRPICDPSRTCRRAARRDFSRMARTSAEDNRGGPRYRPASLPTEGLRRTTSSRGGIAGSSKVIRVPTGSKPSPRYVCNIFHCDLAHARRLALSSRVALSTLRADADRLRPEERRISVGRLRPAITLSEHQPSRDSGRVRSFSLTRTAAPRSSARPWDSRTAGSISHDIALVSGRARLGDAVRT
jgi:hypothetical protein